MQIFIKNNWYFFNIYFYCIILIGTWYNILDKKILNFFNIYLHISKMRFIFAL
jgi:hypothetical protein